MDERNIFPIEDELTDEEMAETVGESIGEMLEMIEDKLWEYEVETGQPPLYNETGLRAATKIFASVIMDQMYQTMEYDNAPMEEREAMVKSCGQEINLLIRKFVGVDMKQLYAEKLNTK